MAIVDNSATPPTYATVNKNTSKKQREQSQNIGSENGIAGEYSVLEDKGGEGGGGSDVVYQVLEGPGVPTYEALVLWKVPAANQAANNMINAQDEEYSTLKYN